MERSCKWVIIAPPKNTITLSWLLFNIEQSYECIYDNVKLFDNNTDFGRGEEIGVFCGSQVPPTFTSSSNIITILFYSDNSVNQGGFLATYIIHEQKDGKFYLGSND